MEVEIVSLTDSFYRDLYLNNTINLVENMSEVPGNGEWTTS